MARWYLTTIPEKGQEEMLSYFVLIALEGNRR